MRILIAAGALLVMLQSPALAFFGHSYNERWCLAGNYAFGGAPDCAYRTYRECEAMQSGVGGFCTKNLTWAMVERKPRVKSREHRY